MDTSSRIIHLIEKWLSEPLDDFERAELESWKNQSDFNSEFLENLQNEQYVKQLVEESYSQKYKQEVHNKLKILIESDQSAIQQQTEVGEVRIWPRLLVAASVIIMLSITAYFLFTKGHPHAVNNITPVVAAASDALPGKFKAKLTLADGSVVILDSAANGQLAQQGSTRVMNKAGKLVYEPTGKPNEVLYNTLATSRGQTYATVLGDGTKVWLNSASSIRYPVAFNDTERQVTITGEAYFEVVHDASRPFYVKVNDMTIQDLGTHFNVNGYSDEPTINTTLLEGKVKIVNRESSIVNRQAAILMPGEQAKLNTKTQQLLKVSDADVDQAVAWRFGYFQFSDDNLPTVLRQLSRWYDVDVVYQGNVPDRSFGGKISRLNSLSQVLATLQTFDVHFTIEGKKIIVSR